MKKQNIFFGIILIGIGLYYFLNQFHMSFLSSYYNGATLLIIIGLAFLLQSHWGGDPNSLLPAVILMGLGVHFYAKQHVHGWPTGWPVYSLIVGLAFLARYFAAKKGGLFIGLILVILSCFSLFNQLVQKFVFKTSHYFNEFWPLLLIVAGLYILIKRK